MVTLQADWTRGAPEVTRLLEERGGSKQVPTILVFAPGNRTPSAIFGGGYTQQIILDAARQGRAVAVACHLLRAAARIGYPGNGVRFAGESALMAELFDPYYKWLGIPIEEQPVNHYRLLGIKMFEADPDVIAEAADHGWLISAPIKRVRTATFRSDCS